VSRDRLPSLDLLGDRLGDAAAREIAAEEEGRRRFRFNPFLLAAILAGLVGAGTVTATGVFTGTGDPVQGDKEGTAQPGVLTDSAVADPGGGLPWALRVFVDDRGRECIQLGRLRDGALGMVANGQFHPYEGEPNGSCGGPREDGYAVIVDHRAVPAERTIVYGRVLDDDPVVIEIDGERTTRRPGALGAFVAAYAGLRDITDATITLTIDGRRVTKRLGPPPTG
jgi:hypothetical protein